MSFLGTEREKRLLCAAGKPMWTACGCVLVISCFTKVSSSSIWKPLIIFQVSSVIKSNFPCKQPSSNHPNLWKPKSGLTISAELAVVLNAFVWLRSLHEVYWREKFEWQRWNGANPSPCTWTPCGSNRRPFAGKLRSYSTWILSENYLMRIVRITLSCCQSSLTAWTTL